MAEVNKAERAWDIYMSILRCISFHQLGRDQFHWSLLDKHLPDDMDDMSPCDIAEKFCTNLYGTQEFNSKWRTWYKPSA